jgi:hypothetical protein
VTNSRVGRVSTHQSLFETLEQVDHAVGNYLKYSIRGGSKRATGYISSYELYTKLTRLVT